jgi:hypothetical protein
VVMADKNSYTPESLISLGREIVSQHISHFLDVVQQRVFGPLKNLFQYAREQEWKQFESIWLRGLQDTHVSNVVPTLHHLVCPLLFIFVACGRWTLSGKAPCNLHQDLHAVHVLLPTLSILKAGWRYLADHGLPI